MAKSSDGDKRMAAELKRRGIFHGKRQGPGTSAPSIPVNQPGSAAYRRMMNKLTRRSN